MNNESEGHFTTKLKFSFQIWFWIKIRPIELFFNQIISIIKTSSWLDWWKNLKINYLLKLKKYLPEKYLLNTTFRYEENSYCTILTRKIYKSINQTRILIVQSLIDFLNNFFSEFEFLNKSKYKSFFSKNFLENWNW